MTKKEIVRERHNCPVSGSSVTVVSTYAVMVNPSKKWLTGWDCEQKGDCAVSVSDLNGRSITYDWKKCPLHSEPKK